MNVAAYRERRRRLQESEPRYRRLCTVCLQPDFSCYCGEIRKFDPGIKFVILNHPIEMRRRIATGRMSHLCLEDSELIVGHDYSADPKVNALIEDPRFHPVILYPGPSSFNLSLCGAEEKRRRFPGDRKLLVFVIDGTWATARQTSRQSDNLRRLPRISFTPPRASNFRVRKQPASECFSTIEAIHHSIELLGDVAGFDLSSRRHDHLIEMFDLMVERQLRIIAAKGRERLSPRAWRQYRLDEN
ncbi:MAG: DTW domain-containing protein [Bdellovibrionaceae bacterium]|nr:DTW domain-containing protein [Pseudobdellovibrionaceae bacterium]